MKKKIIFLALGICLLHFSFSQQSGITFKSSDTALERAFNWAKSMALHYKGKSGDAVGAWYESALPPRDAFCMRDISHMSIGAEILGLRAENKNMLTLFVKNISENKDWCTYWEINKHNKPAPEDYRNDKEFWYNLDANFDLLSACWKLYLWTADTMYITNKQFLNFYRRTANEFIKKWSLQEDSLLNRSPYPNVPVPFHVDDPFHRCRGLPSYSEGVKNLKMGVDLVAAIYQGLLSYAEILNRIGDSTEAKKFLQEASRYQQHIDKYWWDGVSERYYTYYSNDRRFGLDEGETFLLWFDALKNLNRKEKTIAHLNSTSWNIENMSYFPLIMYSNGYPTEGYRYLMYLSSASTRRREYPEVSFGVMEGIVQGVMGIACDARAKRVTTLYHGRPGDICSVGHLSVLGREINVAHNGNSSSVFANLGTKTIFWRPKFFGNYNYIIVNEKKIKAKTEKDDKGNVLIYVDLKVMQNQKVEVHLPQKSTDAPAK